VDRLREESPGYNGDWALTDLKRPFMNLPKGFEYLNTAFYSNVPGGDYIYFVLEVADKIKKKEIGASPKLTIDQIKALKMANGIFVKFEKHTFCGYFGEHGPFQ